MTLDQATKATRNGAIAICVSAVMTLAVMIIAMTSDDDGELALFNDPFILIDIVLGFTLAFGIYKHSRLAAVIAFFYFLASKVIISIETGSFTGIGVWLILLVFIGKSIYGAFVYHRLKLEADAQYHSVSRKGALFMSTGAIFVIVSVSFSLMSVLGVVPSTRVLAGHEIADGDLQLLQSEGVLSDNEKVEFFYAHGLTSILESGNILTNKRVILYYSDESSRLHAYAIPVNEVTAVDLEEVESDFVQSVYLVSTAMDDRWIKLSLPTEQKGDRKFVEHLRKHLE